MWRDVSSILGLQGFRQKCCKTKLLPGMLDLVLAFTAVFTSCQGLFEVQEGKVFVQTGRRTH